MHIVEHFVHDSGVSYRSCDHTFLKRSLMASRKYSGAKRNLSCGRRPDQFHFGPGHCLNDSSCFAAVADREGDSLDRSGGDHFQVAEIISEVSGRAIAYR